MFFVGIAAVGSILLFSTVVLLAPEWIGSPPPPPISESYDGAEYQEKAAPRVRYNSNTEYRMYEGTSEAVRLENEKREKRDSRFNKELKVIDACTARKDFACAEEHYKTAINFIDSYTHTEQLNAAHNRISSEKAKLGNSTSYGADSGAGLKILSTLVQAAGRPNNESNQNLQQRPASTTVQQRPVSATVQQQQVSPTTSTNSSTTRRCLHYKRLCEKNSSAKYGWEGPDCAHYHKNNFVATGPCDKWE